MNNKTMFIVMYLLLSLFINKSSASSYPSMIVPLDTAIEFEFTKIDYDSNFAMFSSNKLIYPNSVEKEGWRGILALYPNNLTADIDITINELSYENATLILVVNWYAIQKSVEDGISDNMMFSTQSVLFNQSIISNMTYNLNINKKVNGGLVSTKENPDGISPFSYEGFDNGTIPDDNSVSYGYNSITAYILIPEKITWNHTVSITLNYSGEQDKLFYDYLMNRGAIELKENEKGLNFSSDKFSFSLLVIIAGYYVQEKIRNRNK